MRDGDLYLDDDGRLCAVGSGPVGMGAPDGYELVPVEVVDALVSIYYNDTEGLGWASDYATVREWLEEDRPTNDVGSSDTRERSDQ